MPYFLECTEYDELSYGFKEVDGDIASVEAVDLSKDGGVSPRRGAMVNRGRRVRPDYMPTKVVREGQNRMTPEVIPCWSIHIVSDRFRNCVEELEPDLHQFFRIELLWKDGSLAAERYLMVVCNRLDAIHRELTTMRFSGVLWEPIPGGENEVVLDSVQCEGHHLWRDKHLISAPIVSDELAKALERAEIVGLSLRRIRADG